MPPAGARGAPAGHGRPDSQVSAKLGFRERVCEVKQICAFVWFLTALTPTWGTASEIPYPLQNKVKDADVVLIGTLVVVERERFSIVYHKWLRTPTDTVRCGAVDHTYTYDVGELRVKEVLKGESSRNEHWIAFASRYSATSDDRLCRSMEPDPNLTFYKGQSGIWILRRNRVILRDYLGATYHDAVVPLDSLEAVKEYIVRDNYVGE